jgi:hypothetical protein
LTHITIKFTTKEVELLSSLACDQLFRIEFIDSRLPGYKSNAADLSAGKKLVERLRAIAGRAKRMPPAAKNGTIASRIS